MTSTANGSALSNAGLSQAPKMRAFQLGSSATGNLSESVNLYRGNITFPLNLVNLPGAPHLGIKASASYQSNVGEQVDSDNLTAPTGVLGLGWSWSFDFIEMEFGAQASFLSATFYLHSSGTPSKLIAMGKNGDDYGFASREFPLWDIRYTPSNETWRITRDDGSVATFGGPDDDRNLLWKSVRWGNWVGGSVNDEAPGGSPESFVSGWNLASVETQWQERLIYSYEADLQAIGAGSLRYTRAIYPATVSDNLGRAVLYSYDNKEADEYVNPDAVPQGAPGVAFQNRFETKFLDKVEVYYAPALNDDGSSGDRSLNYRIQFGWQLQTKDTFRKRYLVSAQQTYASGQAIPAMEFAYDFNTSSVSYGRMTKLTYPSGGTVSWQYDALDLSENDVFGLNFEAQRPSDGNYQDAVPRIWFGQDYVVVLWCSESFDSIRLRVYQHGGRWSDAWETDLPYPGGGLENLRATLSGDFFALYVDGDRQRDTARIYAFTKEPFAFGTFQQTQLQFELNGDSVIAEETQLVSGDGFVAIHVGGSPDLVAFNFSPISLTWSSARTMASNRDSVHMPIAAGGPMLAASRYDDSSQTTQDVAFALTSWGSWKTLAMTQSRSDVFTWNAIYCLLYWSVGDDFMVGTYLADADQGSQRTSLRVLQWDSAFSNARISSLDGGNQVTELGPSMIASGGFYYRFNGKQWVATQSSTSNETRYTFGQDTLLETRVDGGNLESRLFSYNAFSSDPAAAWSHATFPSSGAEPGSGSPQISESYMTWNQQLYHRDPNAAWLALPTTMSGADPASVINRGPYYVLYQNRVDVPEDSQSTLLLLHNGAVVDSRNLGAERFLSDSSGAGLSLAGMSCFATYPADHSFDRTSGFTLYRVQNQNADAVQSVTVVTGVVLDNMDHQEGTEQTYAYDYDVSRAVLDVTGTIVQFPRAVANQVSSDGRSTYNSKEHLFFNGLDTTESANQPMGFYSLLNGMKYQETLMDGNGTPLSQTTYLYTAVTLNTVNHGGFTPLSQTVQIQPAATTASLLNQPSLSFGGGVLGSNYDLVLSESVSYDANTGYVRQRQSSNVDSNGNQQSIVDRFTYAYEVYPAMRSLGFLNPQVLIEHLVDNQTQYMTATTWKDWTGQKVWDEFQTWTWNGEGTPSFDFTAANHPNFLNMDETVRRNPAGFPEFVRDLGAPDTSILYDTSGRRKLARMKNGDSASKEVSYTGFESYEADMGWRDGNNQRPTITTQDCHTGRQAAILASSGTKLQNQFQARAETDTVILTCWYRFTSSNGAGLLSLRAGNQSEQQSLDGHTEWTYKTLVMTLDDHSTALDLDCEITLNGGGGSLLIDNIVFGPMASPFSAAVFDSKTWQSQAALGNNGEVLRLFYNGQAGLAAMVGPDESCGQINGTGFSRSATGSYDKNDPNWQILIKAREGGPYDGFRNQDWQAQWQTVSGSSSDWAVDDQRLTLQTNGPKTVRYNTAVDTNSLALSVRLDLTESQGSASLSLGNLELQWDQTTQTWELSENGQVKAQSTSQTLPAAQYLLWSLHGEASVVMVNGQRVLDTTALSSSRGQERLEVSLSSTGSSIAQLAMAQAPATTFTLLNGNSQKLQIQQVEDSHLAVQGVLNDPLGRQAIVTKWMRYDSVLPGYRSSLITGFDAGSGLMSGDINAYYQGQEGRSNDEGYPYYRQRLELNERAQVLETGLAGRAFAIRPGNTKTRQFWYGLNAQGGLLASHLPAGQYPVRLTTDADGNQSLTLLDQLGNKLGQAKGGPNLPTSTVSASFSEFDKRNYETRINLPNASWPPLAGEAPFVVQREFDNFGRQLSCTMGTQTASDTGQTDFVYDSFGRKRFMLDEDGRGSIDGEDCIRYICYDNLGRTTEEGTFAATWNRTTLQNMADNNTPPANSEWTFRYSYDGDQDNPYARGRLWQTQSRDSDGEIAYETLRYDVAGNVISKTLVYQGTYETNYQYDHLGHVTDISYPDTSGEQSSLPLNIRYVYESTGRVASIQQVNGSIETPLVNYTWNAEGSLESKTYDPAGSNGLETVYHYNSPGWLKSLASDIFNQSFTYEDNSNGFARYSGLITGETVTRPNLQFSRDYGYDSVGRLDSASYDPNGTYNVGIPSPMHYDANGNIMSLSQNDGGSTIEAQLVLDTNTDKLKQVSLSNGQSWDYDYTPAGRTSDAAEADHFSYDPLTGRLLQMQAKDANKTTITYRYSSNQQWLRKTESAQGTTTLDRRYLSGANDRVLAEREITPTADTSRFTVWGIGGPVAMVENGRISYLCNDHLGSLRDVVQNGTSIFQFDYQPYGMLMGQAATGAESYRNRFANMEFDSSTGLYMDGLRPYSPATRRFLTPDPAGQYPSPYIYVGGNPLGQTDQNGAFSLGGFLVSGAEMLVGSIIPGFEFLAVSGAFGMSYSLRSGDDFNWKSFATFEIAGTVSVAELAAGITVDILSAGTLAEGVGGALAGAGISGLVNTTSQLIGMQNGEFSLKEWAIQDALGAVTGAVTAGIGSIFSSGATAVAEGITSAVEGTTGKLLAAGAEGLINTAGKATSGFINDVITQEVTTGKVDLGAALTSTFTSSVTNLLYYSGMGLYSSYEAEANKIANKAITKVTGGKISNPLDEVKSASKPMVWGFKVQAPESTWSVVKPIGNRLYYLAKGEASMLWDTYQGNQDS